MVSGGKGSSIWPGNVPPPTQPVVTLTHTEDVEAEALSDRLADQLVREAVEAHMATQREAPGLWVHILPREKPCQAVNPLER